MEVPEQQRQEIEAILYQVRQVWKVLAAAILADATATNGEKHGTVLLVLVETTHRAPAHQFGVIASLANPLSPLVDREAYDRLLPLCRPVTIPFEEHPDDLSS